MDCEIVCARYLETAKTTTLVYFLKTMAHMHPGENVEVINKLLDRDTMKLRYLESFKWDDCAHYLSGCLDLDMQMSELIVNKFQDSYGPRPAVLFPAVEYTIKRTLPLVKMCSCNKRACKLIMCILCHIWAVEVFSDHLQMCCTEGGVLFKLILLLVGHSENMSDTDVGMLTVKLADLLNLALPMGWEANKLLVDFVFPNLNPLKDLPRYV